MDLTPDIDLPLDVVTEILSYLSLESLLKTCTLNRLFLDLSLHFLYQEIYLDSIDPDIDRTFNTIIRDQLVANRVRRIYIFSCFSVPAEPRCSMFTRNPSQFRGRFNNTLIHLEDLRRLFNRKGTPSPDAPEEAARTGPPLLGSVPTEFGPLLSSVCELTITSMEKYKHIDTLMIFLTHLWERHQVGESLRRLEVAADAIDALMLLLPTIRFLNLTASDRSNEHKSLAPCNAQTSRNPRPCSITHLSIHFIPDTMPTIPNLINKYLSEIFERLASTLLSFSLSYAPYPHADIRRVDVFEHRNLNQQDFSGVLEALPHLPALKAFKFQAPFTLQAMANPGILTKWLRTYQRQLEQLTIRATSVVEFGNVDTDSDDSSASEFNTGDYTPGTRYSNWLTSVAEESDYSGFLSLNFARLRSLEIRAGRPSTHHGRRVLPPLKSIAPSLKSLTLGYDDWLGQFEVEGILQGLPTSQEGYCGLETLRLRYIQLSPELLDLLHKKLPGLKVLVLDCKRLMSSGGLHELSKRKYSWQLSHLRITTSSRVPRSTTVRHFHFHPHLKYMRMVADCVEGDPLLDVEFTCGCK